MSTVVANTQLSRVARFYESTIGKKAIMAVTGLLLFGFLIARMNRDYLKAIWTARGDAAPDER